MTTFDAQQVDEYASAVNAELDRCDHGEGSECATLEAFLSKYAGACCEFVTRIQAWADDVFAGRVAYNEQAEQSWRLELTKLRNRARSLADYAHQAEVKCHSLDEEKRLDISIHVMDWFLDHWVTPKLAVGPSARRKLRPEVIEAARQRVASLKPLPSDWRPYNEGQRKMYDMLRSKLKHA